MSVVGAGAVSGPAARGSLHGAGARPRLIGVAAALILVCALAACGGGAAAGDAAAGAAPATAQVGRAAPSYVARTLAGDSVSLASQRGKVVLLNIWATWCHPCRTEIPALQALYERHRERGLEVVGVSVDAGGEDAAVADFAREYGVTYPLWRDADGRVSTTFAALGVPATYLMDREGVLRWSHLGPVTADDPALLRALEAALE